MDAPFSNKASAFWDKLARKYAHSPVKDPQTYETWLARVAEKLKSTDKVLELGCGTGTTAIKLASSAEWIVASDFSGEMIAIANERLAESDTKNVRFVVGDAFSETLEPSLMGAEGGYDAIMAYSFLHLLEDLEPTLGQIHAMLKPGGLFISKTVCLGNKAWLFMPLIAMMRLFGKAPYVRMLRPQQMDDLVQQSGFSILETTSYGKGVQSRFIIAKKSNAS